MSFNPFDADLTQVARSAARGDFRRFDPAFLMGPVHIVPAGEGQKALFSKDRSQITTGEADRSPLILAGDFAPNVLMRNGRPTKVECPIYYARTPTFPVDIFEQQGSRGDDPRAKGTWSVLDLLMKGMFFAAWQVLKNASLPAGSKSTLALLTGGDGKNITDATCDVVQNIRAMVNLYRANNGNRKPNRILIPQADLEYLASTNTKLLDRMSRDKDAVLTALGVRRYLAAACEIHVEPTEADLGGTQIIREQWTLVNVPKGTPFTPYDAPSLDELAGKTADALFTFPGAGAKLEDKADIDFGELRSAAMVLREFPEHVIEGGAPVGIHSTFDGDITENIRADAFIGVSAVDTAAIFAAYSTRG